METDVRNKLKDILQDIGTLTAGKKEIRALVKEGLKIVLAMPDRASEVGVQPEVSLPKQWQKCPLCNGDGITVIPILGAVNSTHQVCDVCNGKKIILRG